MNPWHIVEVEVSASGSVTIPATPMKIQSKFQQASREPADLRHDSRSIFEKRVRVEVRGGRAYLGTHQLSFSFQEPRKMVS